LRGDEETENKITQRRQPRRAKGTKNTVEREDGRNKKTN
jgi:hypothetical protein